MLTPKTFGSTGGYAMAGEYTLYSMQDSGNCYKPRLLMHQLGIPFRLIETDTRERATQTPEFLALNPNGRVPLLVFPDGRRLSESNAMLLYFAEATKYLPADTYERAICHQWLFFEQYDHEPYVAVARSWLHVFPDRRGKATPEQIAEWHRHGYKALSVMEGRLAKHDWLTGSAYSVADIALYAYTHVAHEGEFDLTPYPAVRRWLGNVASQPGHVEMDWRP